MHSALCGLEAIVYSDIPQRYNQLWVDLWLDHSLPIFIPPTLIKYNALDIALDV